MLTINGLLKMDQPQEGPMDVSQSILENMFDKTKVDYDVDLPQLPYSSETLINMYKKSYAAFFNAMATKDHYSLAIIASTAMYDTIDQLNQLIGKYINLINPNNIVNPIFVTEILALNTKMFLPDFLENENPTVNVEKTAQLQIERAVINAIYNGDWARLEYITLHHIENPEQRLRFQRFIEISRKTIRGDNLYSPFIINALTYGLRTADIVFKTIRAHKYPRVHDDAPAQFNVVTNVLTNTTRGGDFSSIDGLITGLRTMGLDAENLNLLLAVKAEMQSLFENHLQISRVEVEFAMIATSVRTYTVMYYVYQNRDVSPAAILAANELYDRFGMRFDPVYVNVNPSGANIILDIIRNPYISWIANIQKLYAFIVPYGKQFMRAMFDTQIGYVEFFAKRYVGLIHGMEYYVAELQKQMQIIHDEGNHPDFQTTCINSIDQYHVFETVNQILTEILDKKIAWFAKETDRPPLPRPSGVLTALKYHTYIDEMNKAIIGSQSVKLNVDIVAEYIITNNVDQLQLLQQQLPSELQSRFEEFYTQQLNSAGPSDVERHKDLIRKDFISRFGDSDQASIALDVAIYIVDWKSTNLAILYKSITDPTAATRFNAFMEYFGEWCADDSKLSRDDQINYIRLVFLEKFPMGLNTDPFTQMVIDMPYDITARIIGATDAELFDEIHRRPVRITNIKDLSSMNDELYDSINTAIHDALRDQSPLFPTAIAKYRAMYKDVANPIEFSTPMVFLLLDNDRLSYQFVAPMIHAMVVERLYNKRSVSYPILDHLEHIVADFRRDHPYISYMSLLNFKSNSDLSKWVHFAIYARLIRSMGDVHYANTLDKIERALRSKVFGSLSAEGYGTPILKNSRDEIGLAASRDTAIGIFWAFKLHIHSRSISELDWDEINMFKSSGDQELYATFYRRFAKNDFMELSRLEFDRLFDEMINKEVDLLFQLGLISGEIYEFNKGKMFTMKTRIERGDMVFMGDMFQLLHSQLKFVTSEYPAKSAPYIKFYNDLFVNYVKKNLPIPDYLIDLEEHMLDRDGLLSASDWNAPPNYVEDHETQVLTTLAALAETGHYNHDSSTYDVVDGGVRIDESHARYGYTVVIRSSNSNVIADFIGFITEY